MRNRSGGRVRGRDSWKRCLIFSGCDDDDDLQKKAKNDIKAKSVSCFSLENDISHSRARVHCLTAVEMSDYSSITTYLHIFLLFPVIPGPPPPLETYPSITATSVKRWPIETSRGGLPVAFSLPA